MQGIREYRGIKLKKKDSQGNMNYESVLNLCIHNLQPKYVWLTMKKI